MRQRVKQRMSAISIFLLILSLIPIQYFGLPAITFAADSTEPIVITDPVGTQDAPAQASSGRITISGSFYGVSDLSYTIEQYRKSSTGAVTRITSRDGIEKPRIVDSAFIFSDIVLYEGLNKITVRGMQSGAQVTKSTWVEVSNLPIITSVMYDNQNLLTNKVISTPLFRDEIVLKGTIYNATSVVAKVNGKPTEYDGSILNNNTYVIARVPLQRGKNTIELIARNTNKTYPLTITDVIYNDGSPYVEGQLVQGTTRTDLVDPMTFTSSDLTIQGTFHNFTTDTDEVTITFNGESFTYTKQQFDALPATRDATNARKLSNLGSGKFDLYFPTADVKLNAENYLSISFKRAGSTYSQSFVLEHLDKSKNYIFNVSGLSDTSINKRITFYITLANDSSTPTAHTNNYVVHSYNNGSSTVTTPINTYTGTDEPQFPTIRHDVDLEPGMNVITIYPNGKLAGGAYDETNKREYHVMYINSPDVKILNLVNGDRIGTGGLTAELFGELINVPLADRAKTRITIENSSGRKSYYLDVTKHFTDSTKPYQFKFPLNDSVNGATLSIGANDIIVEVSSGGTVTTTRITVFYFTDNAPVATVSLDNDKNVQDFPDFRFKEINTNRYETESRFAYINATYSNAKEIFIYYNGVRVAYIDDTNTIQASPGWSQYFAIAPTLVSGSTPPTYTISVSNPFELLEGENTFEVEAFSSTGLSRSEKLYVTRVNPPVKLIKPDLSVQNVVNSNYIEIVIEAAADKVRIGKEEAKYEKIDPATLRKLIEMLPQSKRAEILRDYDTNNNGILSDEELEKVDQSLVTNPRFVAEYYLKPGKNKVTYEVEANGTKNKYEFEIFYAASPTEGAQYKVPFKSGKMEAFDKKISLTFPKNTWLVSKQDYQLYNTDAPPIFDEFQSEPYVKFGIVDQRSGKLIKIWNELTQQFELEEFVEPYKTLMPVRFLPPDRTGYASQIYWIESEGDLKSINSGFVPTNRAELVIKYDESIRDDAQNLLAIYHFDREKEQWVNMGGVVDTKKKTVTTYITEFGYYAVMAKRGTYNDIFNHEWAGNYLTAMFSKGIMLPETLNRFGSDMLISRGEFATMLVKALEIPIDAGPYLNGDKRYPVNQTFVDVSPLLDPPNGFYSYEYIETAGRAGIIRGMGQGEFGPDGLLTREQAAIMIARAANYKINSDLAKSKAALSKTYNDTMNMSDYSIPYIEAVLKAGVMTGTPVQGSKMMSFNPTQYLTRAETAAIAYRLMQNLKKLPK